MPTHCPECGGPMVLSKPSKRTIADAPGSVPTEEETTDLVASDVDPAEARAVKAGTMVCARCGATLAVPQP